MTGFQNLAGASSSITMQQVSENTNQVNESHHNVAIIGTGFAGLCMAIRLKQQGEEE